MLLKENLAQKQWDVSRTVDKGGKCMSRYAYEVHEATTEWRVETEANYEML